MAAGRVLAAPVVSDVDVPGFDRATMDGYAVVAESTEGATSYNRLPLVVIGDSLPGHPFQGSVGVGQGVRIMTGAPLPLGCDAVLPAEWVEDADGDAMRHRQRPRRRVAWQTCRQTRGGHRPRNDAVPAWTRAAPAGSGRAQFGRRGRGARVQPAAGPAGGDRQRTAAVRFAAARLSNRRRQRADARRPRRARRRARRFPGSGA